jgi:chromosome segregation ATPase
MNKLSSEVIQFAPKQKQGELEPIDQAGHALIGLLKEAADISKDNVQRAMTMAHRLSLELRSAEDRIRELEAEIERLESRATRAEQWLGTIKKEIEDTLIAPMEANRSKPKCSTNATPDRSASFSLPVSNITC